MRKSVLWPKEINDYRIELSVKGFNNSYIRKELYKKFGIDYTVKQISNKQWNEYRLQNKDIQIPIEKDSDSLFKQELYQNESKYIDSARIKEELLCIWKSFQDSNYTKILSLSDLHSPYMNFEKIERAIKDNEDCDICVLNGDIFDNETMSSYDKMNEMDADIEFEQVIELLDVVSKKFKKVYWVGGNHDLTRFKKYIIKNIKPGLRRYAYKKLNPMEHLTEKYDNVIAINHNTLQLGDVIFKHPNRYSGPEMKTVVGELDILLANRSELPNPDFRCICIGHTHDGGTFFKNGVMLMEQCCLCHIPDYRFEEPVKRRWTTGYARIEFNDDKKIIFNKSNVFCLED